MQSSTANYLSNYKDLSAAPPAVILALVAALSGSPTVSSANLGSHFLRTHSYECTSMSREIISSYGLQLSKARKRLAKSYEKAKNSNSESPSENSINHALSTLMFLFDRGIEVDFINPSSEGGIMIEFYLGSEYNLIEIYNDGDVVLLKSEGDKREAMDITVDDLVDTLNDKFA